MESTFKENLKEMLDYNDMTIKELAFYTGISHRSIENYLNSRESIPPADYACKIAKTLHTTVEYLVYGNDTKNEKKEYGSSLLSIIKNFENLKESNQKLVANLVIELASK